MRTQAIGFSASVVVHGAFGLLLFTLVTLVPQVTSPVVIDLSILAGGPAAAPVPQAATIVPAAPPVLQDIPKQVRRQEIIPPKPRKKIVKKSVKPLPETVQLPAPTMVPAVEGAEAPSVSEVPETTAPAAPSTIALREGEAAAAGQGMPVAAEASGTGKALSAEEHWRQEHFTFIKEAIRKNMTYPVLARKNGWQGRVLVSLVICKDGRVEDIRVEKSSGIALLDKNAVETIKRSAPFPNPPVRATLIIPIDYTLG